MLQDRYGNPLSTQSRAAVDKYNAALELIRLYRGDPIAALDAAIEDDPDCAMAWAARAGMLVQQADKAYVEEAERSIRAGWRRRQRARTRASRRRAALVEAGASTMAPPASPASRRSTRPI